MTFTMPENISEYVSGCLQLAILLEVSAYPKPGNVHRTADFDGTRFEHFLASTVAVAPHFRHAAKHGVLVHAQKISLSKVAIGKMIKDAVKDIASWQHGGNTLLGSIILLTPMAVSAGISLAQEKFSISYIRKNLKLIVGSTTPEDAVNLYDAIKTAQPGGLGEAPSFDVTSTASKQRILDERVSLYDVFKISAPWDSVSSEWVYNYPITFDIGYPFLVQQLKENKDTNTTTVHTFLEILSKVPDTLIARKAGLVKAKKVSAKAKQVLEAGALTTQEGRKKLLTLDQELRDPTHQLNPGTTADLTSASLALAILNSYRP